MDNNSGCKLDFKVEAETGDGTRTTLLEWPEVFDEIANDIQVDLSALAGRGVTLILEVDENGGRSLEFVWFLVEPAYRERSQISQLES